MEIKNKRKFYIIVTSILTIGICSYSFINYQIGEEYSSKENTLNEFEDSEMYMSFDYMVYDSPEAIYESSSSVITGEVLSYKDENLNIVMTEEEINQLEDLTKKEKEDLINSSKTPEYFPYRIFDIKVTENYKGKHKIGDVIQVKQLYGKLDGKIFNNEEFLLHLGKEYMLFLEDYPSSPSSLLNEQQSSYFVDKNIKDEEILTPVYKNNKNTLKINKKKTKNLGEKYK